MNGVAADNYSTFNLKRKQQKKTQLFYEPPNEWSNDKRPDRPRVNFVNPNDSKGDDDNNWRAHKAPNVVIVPKVVKKIDEKPAISEKIITSSDIIPTMIINTRVNTVQNIPDKTHGFGNKKREEKKVPCKPISSVVLMNYEKLPPRLQRKFCDDYHISMEEVEALLTNGLLSQDEHNKQNSSYQSRSQTLPPRSIGKGRFHEPQRHDPQRHEPQRHEPQRHEPQRHEPQRHEPHRHEPHRHEPQRHEQLFYRTNSNQLPPKTETRRQQSAVVNTVNSSTESSRRGADIPTKVYNSHHESKTADHNARVDTENNHSISIKQPIESAVLLPSGTIVSFTLSAIFIE